VLVTGSTRGIGRAIALAFAANGADVVVNSNDDEDAEAVIAEVERLGRRSLFVRADVSDKAQVVALFAETLDRFGKLDVLVNNAGVNVGPDRRFPIHEFRDEDWHRILATDLDGVFYCSKEAATHMVARRSGRILNIGSVAGLVPLRLQIAFVAAKAGVANLTRGMALELAPYGVRVNAIAPGSILTEGTRELFYGAGDPEKRRRAESLVAHIPLGEPGKPDDIANAALFLASPASGYVTGHVLVVDGGWTCGYNREW
jgi:NAD(P)-dependent dehydrogenase (short-subunit alcohol dehydrogenase family)